MAAEKSFADYQREGHLWITLATGEYYPDVLPLACELYKPVLVLFGQLIRSSHSSADLFLAISATTPSWMRVQLSRVFRKYVSPATPVEMLRRKRQRRDMRALRQPFSPDRGSAASVRRSSPPGRGTLCIPLGIQRSGEEGLRSNRTTVRPASRPVARNEDHRARGAGKDVLMREVFPDYPKPDRPVDFVIYDGPTILAVGLARYDSDRGGAQEDDRPGQYRECALELIRYADSKGLHTKMVFLNDGPGLLLGSMWDDYAHIENSWPGRVKVVTLRMVKERITLDWLRSRRKR